MTCGGVLAGVALHRPLPSPTPRALGKTLRLARNCRDDATVVNPSVVEVCSSPAFRDIFNVKLKRPITFLVVHGYPRRVFPFLQQLLSLEACGDNLVQRPSAIFHQSACAATLVAMRFTAFIAPCLGGIASTPVTLKDHGAMNGFTCNMQYKSSHLPFSYVPTWLHLCRLTFLLFAAVIDNLPTRSRHYARHPLGTIPRQDCTGSGPECPSATLLEGLRTADPQRG